MFAKAKALGNILYFSKRKTLLNYKNLRPMQTEKQSNKLNFTGQNIYAGIDAHLKSWTVTIQTDELQLRTFNQPPKPELLQKHLQKNFPGASYYCAYEAGFCGFWIYDKFKEMGIDCLVVNPADVPTTDKEKKQKTDPRDSRKLARSLANGELEGIYIHEKEDRECRALIRRRKQLARDLTRCKNRIKSFLYFHGIELPEGFKSSSTHWSQRFIKWLESITLKTEAGTSCLKSYIKQAISSRELLLDVTRQIRQLSKTDKYVKQIELLRSVTGVGPTSAMIFLTEVGNIKRFRTFDQLSSYVGLICDTSSSGDKESVGEMTRRGNPLLKETIIECSWVAIRHDPALLMTYKRLVKTMKPNKAIVRIAKKLLNRIRFVLKNEKPYTISVVK
jgi:transposase